MLTKVKLIPGDGPTTRGTKVVLPDGTELTGILRVVLTGEPNDIWRAEITVQCLPPELQEVEADLKVEPEPMEFTPLRGYVPDPGWNMGR